jgi:hypothetical protein
VPQYYAPGVYVEEISSGPRPIQAVGTSTAAFIGEAPRADLPEASVARAINNWSEFVRDFVAEGSASTALSHAVYGFFLNGGRRCYVVNVSKGQAIVGDTRRRRGLQLLEAVDEVAIVAAPGYTDAASYDALLSHCESLKDRVAILDPPREFQSIAQLTEVALPPEPTERKPARDTAAAAAAGGASAAAPAGLRPRQSDDGYGAFYFPNIMVRDPLGERLVEISPSGHLAGIYARSDATRGVHKAPANETVRGALRTSYSVTHAEQETLNQFGVNCIRQFSGEGVRVWGARTLAAAASNWRYLNVRRLFNMIEESIAKSTRWCVFEPNDRLLWGAIKRDVTAFLTNMWRDGALMGRNPGEAFFVRCDEETNPPESIDQGLVVTLVGLAPVKPAEFIVFRIGQHAGGVEVETQGGSNG